MAETSQSLSGLMQTNQPSLKTADPAVFLAIEREKERQQNHLELIASENIVSRAVMEAVGSVLTNKYAEGYPNRRYYGGCEYVDDIEELAIERVKQIFGAEHANVQPHSGTQANMAVYMAMLQPGDKMLTMRLDHGGHLTHGHPKNMSGLLYKIVHYGVDLKTGMIDYDDLEALALRERPKMMTVGASAYARTIDFKRLGAIAKSCGALLMADMAHIAGLVAVGLHPSPVPYADFVTSTTHKTLRGPRGGFILCKKEYAQAIDAMLFPGIQGGPLMHVIAGKAVCFGEALKPEFRVYQQQVIKNTQKLADCMKAKGYCIVSGGTDNHLFLIDLRTKFPSLTGKQAQDTLDSVHITTNRNTIPGDNRSPFQASGLRLGAAAVTSRGMQEKEMSLITEFIDQALSSTETHPVLGDVRQQVMDLCAQFPIPF